MAKRKKKPDYASPENYECFNECSSQRRWELYRDMRYASNAWERTAARHFRNECFYHDIVTEVGEQLHAAGFDTKTSDDGSEQDGVLSMKVVCALREALSRIALLSDRATLRA